MPSIIEQDFFTWVVPLCICSPSAGDDGERDIAGHHQLRSHDRRRPALPHPPEDVAVLRHYPHYLDRVSHTCRAIWHLQNLYGIGLFFARCIVKRAMLESCCKVWERTALNIHCKVWREGRCRFTGGKTLLKERAARLLKKFKCGGWSAWSAWRGCLSSSCSAATPPSLSTSGAPDSGVGHTVVSRAYLDGFGECYSIYSQFTLPIFMI